MTTCWQSRQPRYTEMNDYGNNHLLTLALWWQVCKKRLLAVIKDGNMI